MIKAFQILQPAAYSGSSNIQLRHSSPKEVSRDLDKEEKKRQLWVRLFPLC
jgi:hypothetical protein